MDLKTQNNAEFQLACTGCSKKQSSEKNIQYFLKIKSVTPQYIQWTLLTLLYQTLWEIPLVHEGFKETNLEGSTVNSEIFAKNLFS